MTGGTSVDMPRENPAGEDSWLSNKTWCGIMELSRKLKRFEGFDVDFEKNVKVWETIYDSN